MGRFGRGLQICRIAATAPEMLLVLLAAEGVGS